MGNRYIYNLILVTFLFIVFIDVRFVLAEVNKNFTSKDASKLANEVTKEKKAKSSVEKEMFNFFYKEGTKCYKNGDYPAALGNFEKASEINPGNKDVTSYIKKINAKMESMESQKKYESSDDYKIKSSILDGKVYLSEGEYEKALDSFGNVLNMDPNNKEASNFALKAKRALMSKGARTESKETKKDLGVTILEKEAVEQERMLDVDRAYLPPEKPVKRKIEVEEVVSDELTKEEEAKKKLLEELKTKIVPAVSLTDADIRDVIRQLMDMTGVTIVVDEKALAEINQGAALKLTFSTVSSMPLLDLLDIALKTSGLNYRIEPTYIWISTPAKLQSENLVTKTYKLKYGVRRIRKVELEKFETTSGSSN